VTLGHVIRGPRAAAPPRDILLTVAQENVPIKIVVFDNGKLGFIDIEQGTLARESFSAPEFPRQATEPRCLEQLPWPRNLFGELASIAELMDDAEHGGKNAGDSYVSLVSSRCAPIRGIAREGS
jgi:hypothetical protein